uniref:Tetraspanin n=1 Tax=Glossina brevipalpis TaxID=37001 RepID=A0A1A9WI32_9MUSC
MRLAHGVWEGCGKDVEEGRSMAKEGEGWRRKYVTLMSAAFFLHLILLTYFSKRREFFLNLISQFVDEAWKQKKESMDAIVAMDALQMKFNCCGVHGYLDYSESNQRVPFTCCKLDISTCSMKGYEIVPGCREAFVSYWDTKTEMILFSGIAIAGVQLACLIIGFWTVYKLTRK